MNYGLKLKDIRTQELISQREVAEKLGISRTTYKEYELQYSIIPSHYLVDFCDMFNVSVDYALSLTDKKSYKNSKIGVEKNEVGKRLKEFRKENKLTQVKLAEILNTVHPVITNYENGKHLIATPFLYDICKNYKISADYLLGKIDNPKYIK